MANTSFDTLISGQKSALDTLQAFAYISLDSIEKAASHHLSSSRRVLEQQFKQSKDILDSKDVPGTVSLGHALVQQHIDNGIDYLRGLHEIANESREQAISLLESNHGEWHKAISSTLDWYAKSSGHADAVVRSAVSAANSAFENAHKTARQVASIADASVKAATSVTSRAIEVSSPARKKAA